MAPDREPSKGLGSRTVDRLDRRLMLRTFETLQQIAKFMREVEKSNDELRIFYTHLTAYCAMIGMHSHHIHTGSQSQSQSRTEPPDGGLISMALSQLNSIVIPNFCGAASGSLGRRLHALNQSWDDLRSKGESGRKLTFIRSALDFGSTPQQQKQLLDSLSILEDEIRTSYMEEDTKDDFSPPKLIREPTYAAWSAARSIFKALLASKNCPCMPSHDFSAHLCLGTYRRPCSGEESDDDNDDDEMCFDMLLSMENDLHEARVRAARETAVRWAIDSGADTSRAKISKPKPKPRSMKVKMLCEPMAKMRTMAAYRLELKVARDQLFKLQSKRSDSPLDKTRSPVSLHQLLNEASRSFTERTRRILAVILSFAVLHLHDTQWLQPPWDSSSILFHPTASSAIPLRPFIHVPIRDSFAHGSAPHQIDLAEIDPDDIDPDDLDPDDFIQHQCPSLVTLAIMLMEVYFVTPFDYLVKKYAGGSGERSESSGGLRYIDANVVFQALKGEIPENSQFHYAVEKCLDPAVWEDEEGRRLDNETLSARIYQEVVLPLETELSQLYSSIPIEDLDRFAQGLDFANWDQTIQPWRSQDLADSSDLASNLGRGHSLQSPGLPTEVAFQGRPLPRNQSSENQAFLPYRTPSPWTQRPAGKYDDDSLISCTPIKEMDYKRSKFFDDEMPFAGHTAQAMTSYAVWRSRYQTVYGKFIPTDPSANPVKIAILDSGADLSHPDIEARIENIKGKYNWLNEKRRHAIPDRDGHGTFVTGLVLDYAPDAELYVAKIADSAPADPGVIAQAIRHAIDTWKVDIISMSFGFPTCAIPSYSDLETALMTAYSRGVLVFAAASNNGGKLGRAFPAREPTVIAVHSTDANGNCSDFNPTAVPEDINLATVGEAVESAWPVHLCDEAENPSCVAHKSGTSFSTPIMAGIAAFLLAYARTHLSREQAAALRSHKRMRAVLRRVAEKGMGGGEYRPRDGYHFVDLSLYADSLFGKSKDFIDLTIGDILNR